MIIDKNISKYIVFCEESIRNALEKINENEEQIIFAVTASGILEGILTDGDFRRWLLSIKTKNINLNQKVYNILNKNYKYALISDTPEKIKLLLNELINFIPVLDDNRRLVAIAKKRTKSLRIGDFMINDSSSAFVIAEIGNNHNGDFELAKKLVDAAKEAGADCAKFQMRNLHSLYRNFGRANDAEEDLGSQYTLDLLSRFQLPNELLFKIFDYCKAVGILPLCTPWDIESYRQLEKHGMEAFKVASADFTNHELLEVMAKSGKPLICSTGMSTELEISKSIDLLKHLGAQYILLHCNSTYPAPFKDIQLSYMNRLREMGDCYVGYSGHERGTSIALAAVAIGAKIIEKHFTLDKTMEGNDHRVSLLPQEFTQMVEGIREIESSLGTVQARTLTQGEFINRETLGKSLVINCDLNAGEVITSEMIEVKSPGKGLPPYFKEKLIDKIAKRTFKKGDFFYSSDYNGQGVKNRNFKFSRPWGIPVRYHDLKNMLTYSNFDLLEFHLSYKDLEEDIEKYFVEPLNLDFIVHSPELFSGDHILDLCTSDETYRRHSISELQKVVDITRRLKPFFKRSNRPLIIVNVGGFTQNAPLKESEVNIYYERLVNSLSKINAEGVEIIPQTMPPFPWLFGGQRFHNLFVKADKIADFCQKNQYRICLDTAHSKLACNHYNVSFDEFIENIGHYVAHLHIVDAKGVDAEGLQIGEGEIDFYSIGKTLKKYAPDASFIPEIWQGHKNNGEGFWVALDRLGKWI